MTKINALIIDDEPKSRNILRQMLNDYCPKISVIGEAGSVDDAFQQIQSKQPNLLFLDVEMPYGSGFDLLKSLPKIDFEVIFVTGFDHYALQAIKFHALDYLLKPVDIDELILAAERVEQSLQQTVNTQRLLQLMDNLKNPNRSTHQVAIPTGNGREFIPVEDIVRCSADGSCTWFYLRNHRKLLSSKNLGEYEKILPGELSGEPHKFYRVHYSDLINLYYIQSINRQDNLVAMKDGTEINIAQRRKAPFLDLLKRENLY